MRPKLISITRNESEWTMIHQRIKEEGKSNLNNYIVSAVNKLDQKVKENPECLPSFIGSNKRIRPQLPHATYQTLKNISEKTNCPIGIIIDEFIITPLLQP